jgi:hypothetical protein
MNKIIIKRKIGYSFLKGNRGGFLEKTIIDLKAPFIFGEYLGTSTIFWKII